MLIKLNATGICHSDLHFMLNDWALPKMSVFGTRCAGHEGAGVIVKVGDQVKTLKPGMRAGYKVKPLYGCERLRLTMSSRFKIPVVPASSVEVATSATVQRPSSPA